MEIPSIKTQPGLRLDWRPAVIIPVGDVQFGSQACNSRLFRLWIERILKTYDNKDYQLFFLGMGDYTDSIRPSMRKRLNASNLLEDEHFSKSIEDIISEHMRGFLSLVSGTEGKWLGLLEGHHYFDFGNGVTSDTLIADELKAPFLGDCTRIHLTFDRRSPGAAKTKATEFSIWAHHGEGGGVMAGAPLNKLERLKAVFQADVLVMGHQHKAVATKVPWNYDIKKADGSWENRQKDIGLLATGAWLEGYVQDSRVDGRPGGHYPEQKMLPPLSLGGTRIVITPVHEKDRDYIHHDLMVG